MLLVDDDQPEPLDRGEHGRARADADPRLAAAQAHPLVVALARREPRMRHGDGVAEALDEARHRLRRQPDLGHEHDHAAALRERGLGGAQVDLGLAGAGDAVQEQRLVACVARSRRRSPRAPRSGRRRAPARRRDGRRRRRGPGSEHAGGGVRRSSPRCSRRRSVPWAAPVWAAGVPPSLREPLEHLALQRGQAGAGAARLAPRGGQLGDQLLEPADAGAGARRQHQRERARRRRAVLERDPARQLDEVLRHVRLDRAPRREQALARRPRSTSREPDDDAEQLAAPERHDAASSRRRRCRASPREGRSRTAHAARARS